MKYFGCNGEDNLDADNQHCVYVLYIQSLQPAVNAAEVSSSLHGTISNVPFQYSLRGLLTSHWSRWCTSIRSRIIAFIINNKQINEPRRKLWELFNLVDEIHECTIGVCILRAVIKETQNPTRCTYSRMGSNSASATDRVVVNNK